MADTRTVPHTVASGRSLFSYTGMGITSRREIRVDVCAGTPGTGVVFLLKDPKSETEVIELPSRAEFVVSTLRNVTLGSGGVRLSIVEHFLAAMALWGFEDLTVAIDGPELPLGDGSANFWLDLARQTGVPQQFDNLKRVELLAPIVLSKGERSLVAVPDSQFSVTYLINWQHPLIGKKWCSWNPGMPITEIADARTFGSLKEHQMLALSEDVVSLTADGFTQPLRFDDEPVRHKLLDLIGDLSLVGVNPLRLNARFISIQGGHELDVELAKAVASAIKI